MDFFNIGSKVSDEVEEFIGGMNYLVNIWFVQFYVVQKFKVFFFGFQFSNISFNSCIDENDFCRFIGYSCFKMFGVFIVIIYSVFFYIVNVKDRFGCKQEYFFQQGLFGFVQFNGLGRFFIFQVGQYFLVDFQVFQVFFVVVFGLLFEVVYLFFYGFDVFEQQFCINCIFVVYGVYIVIYVDYVVFIKVVYYMYYCIYFLDIGQELIVQAFFLICVFDQAGNINNFNCGRLYFLWIDQFCQFVKVGVRNSDDVYVGVFGCEWIIGCQCFG